MTGTPSNPFANLSPPSGSLIGTAPNPSAPSTPPGQRAKINRFTALEFSGTAMQLFGVQAVNLILTCLTIGLWTPWARVRRRRFFYNNTRILDEGVDYLATGFDLFKGWLVVVLFLAAFYATPFLGVPFLQEGLSLLFPIAYPWVINRSLRFNARCLAWRDVRFDFNGSYFASLWYFFLFPIIAILPFGLLIPLASKAMRGYIARCYSFGTAEFDSDGNIGSYYGAGFKAALLFIICAAAILGGFYSFLMITEPEALLQVVQAIQNEDQDAILNNLMTSSVIGAVPIAFLILFYVIGTYYRALTRNIMVGALRLQGGIRFRSNLSGGILAWIMISNFVAVILSFGLLWPWAQVRRYRYICQATEIRPINDLGGFVDKQLKSGHSVGDALGETGDLGIQF